MKLTPWFPASVVPVRVGVYEVRDQHIDTSHCFAYWDGDRFGFRVWNSPKNAAHPIVRKLSTSLPMRTEWRGVRRTRSGTK